MGLEGTGSGLGLAADTGFVPARFFTVCREPRRSRAMSAAVLLSSASTANLSTEACSCSTCRIQFSACCISTSAVINSTLTQGLGCRFHQFDLTSTPCTDFAAGISSHADPFSMQSRSGLPVHSRIALHSQIIKYLRPLSLPDLASTSQLCRPHAQPCRTVRHSIRTWLHIVKPQAPHVALALAQPCLAELLVSAYYACMS